MEGYSRNYRRRNYRRRPWVFPRYNDWYGSEDWVYWDEHARLGENLGVQGRQLPFNLGVQRLDGPGRARRVPWMPEWRFQQIYGMDADYDQWLEARRYRDDDLANPRVFRNIVADRKVNFQNVNYGWTPEELEYARDMDEFYLEQDKEVALKRERWDAEDQMMEDAYAEGQFKRLKN